MVSRTFPIGWFAILFVSLVGCGDRNRENTDSTSSLAPVFPRAPVINTGWDGEAGSVAVVPFNNSSDTVSVIIPEATDSTVGVVESIAAPVSGLAFDLFSRAGKVASMVRSIPLPPVDTSKQECYSWPLARLAERHVGWTVGFPSGRAQPIQLDSIDALRGSDSASLAAALVRASATLPGVSDPTFRGLPFRVRSAFMFRVDSVDAVIADVVRVVNEEANPRIEHILLVGERPSGASTSYNVRYSDRTAGKEETVSASELITVLAIGASRRPAIVISIGYSDGNRLGLLEKIGGDWRATWRSAYTDC